jgi:uncharacterized Zn finger protein
MPNSKCPSCGNTSFEIVENTPSKSAFKFHFIQCSKCGCVVGTHEYFNVGSLIINLAKKLHIDLP